MTMNANKTEIAIMTSTTRRHAWHTVAARHQNRSSIE